MAPGFLILLLCSVADVSCALGVEETNSHWSLRPVLRPAVPSVSNRKWKPRNPIDNFIFAKLAESKLSPSPEASRRTLIRRLYFDLIGLPPTPEEVQAFEKDKSPDAYSKLVERLLASPQYGERWARHWLDVVRFAETHGFEMNNPRPSAWRYRDYVIHSFNEDKPYDRFILEQFAGDVFGEDAATGFLVGGAWDQVKSPDPVLTAAQRADELHDMVSTTGSAFLGLTVGCARCHNHKFDPIPQVDYYALKACLAGVQHGERKLRTPDQASREEQGEKARRELGTTEIALEQFEPIAFTGRLLMLEPEPVFGSSSVMVLKRGTTVRYSEGTSRGEKDDPGDIARLPNLTHGYITWSNSTTTDVFTCQPGLEGRYHVWLSWGCGSESYAKDALYLLDPDGNLSTTNDQVVIAQVNQRQFADRTGGLGNKHLWSGFYDGGIWTLASSNKIVLRGGAGNAEITTSTMAFVEQPETEASASLSDNSGSKAPNFLRSAVNPRRNVERFSPVKATRLRFTVARTTDAEPCIDELEVYSVQPHSTNIALASTGTKATASTVFPNSDIHKIEHINDGKVGNSHSWISNERGKGWIELEFPQEATINRIVWGRDREQQFSDRLALQYRVEVALGSNDWRLVASSQDRVPYVATRPVSPDLSINGLSDMKAAELKQLLVRRTELEARIKELTAGPMVYAGKLDKPEPTYRLQRGDPMQQRELINAGTLSAISVPFNLDACIPSFASQNSDTDRSGSSAPALTDDQKRRLALARWIADPDNPLPARVIVNRLWQHHFGEGIVSTPSDFGKKGVPPTHPELLDWLAAELVNASTLQRFNASTTHPWSLKHIHRLIVNSATYRQASAVRPDGISTDAASRLLWRFPPQRLEAEPLRDAILAVSGKLDLTPGGPGFSAFEPNDNYVRVYNPKKEFGPDEWRRMVYMTKVRMQQDATFGAFDCPDGGQIAPKRMRSTTPLQALNLLNSEFMLQQAGFFAARLEKEAGNDPKSQVRLAFGLAFNRAPDPEEIKTAQSLISQHGLLVFCRAVFNSNEFIFVE
jgi:hypothetical protein